MASAIVRLLPVHELKIRYLNYYLDDLTSRERKFIKSIRERVLLSDKQIRKLEEIYNVFRWNEKFHWEEVSETWGEE